MSGWEAYATQVPPEGRMVEVLLNKGGETARARHSKGFWKTEDGTSVQIHGWKPIKAEPAPKLAAKSDDETRPTRRIKTEAHKSRAYVRTRR